MFVVQVKKGRRWKSEPIEYRDVKDAAMAACRLYEKGETVRVVDKRFVSEGVR